MATTLERDYNARRMRNRVSLQRPIDEGDFGGRRTWEPVADVWAEILHTSPRGTGGQSEVAVASGTEAIARYGARIRYRTDIASEWRVVDKETGRVWYVHGPPVIAEERNRWLDLSLVLVEGEYVSETA